MIKDLWSDKILINDGVKVHFRIRYGSGVPIIFLHGGGSSISAWDLILPYLSDLKNTLVTFDFRGHGLSDRPEKFEDYKIEKHAEDLEKIIQYIKSDKVILVGHCFGSFVAVTYSSIHPDKVVRLVIINSCFRLPWFMIKSILYPFLMLVEKISSFLPLGKQKDYFIDYGKFRETGDLNLFRLYADIKVMGLQSAIRQFLAYLFWDGEKYFRNLKVQVLFIAGTKDSVFPRRFSQETAQILGMKEPIWIDSNHISVVSIPERVVTAIKPFLQ